MPFAVGIEHGVCISNRTDGELTFYCVGFNATVVIGRIILDRYRGGFVVLHSDGKTVDYALHILAERAVVVRNYYLRITRPQLVAVVLVNDFIVLNVLYFRAVVVDYGYFDTASVEAVQSVVNLLYAVGRRSFDLQVND